MFKVGDIVEAFGFRGAVTDVHDDGTVNVYFGAIRKSENFYSTGHLFRWHKEPSLKLIERPKKKVKKIIERWINVYEDGLAGIVYDSEQRARQSAQGAATYVGVVKLTGEYEVEVDE
jgi:hypothetical protein